MAAEGAESTMPALALDISGLYLGTGVEGAVGGAVVTVADVRFVPLAGGALMMLSFLLTHMPLNSAADGPQKTADVSSPSTLT